MNNFIAYWYVFNWQNADFTYTTQDIQHFMTRCILCELGLFFVGLVTIIIIDFKMPSDSISMHLFVKIYLGGIPPDF